MIPGSKTSEGALYITSLVPQPTSTFNGGVAVSDTGAIHVSGLLPEVFANGLGLRNSGALCIAPGGVRAGSAMGLPFTADGRLVTQLNQPVSPSDSYVGGIRVGPLGGVYTSDVSPPPPEGFSNGFDTGFGV